MNRNCFDLKTNMASNMSVDDQFSDKLEQHLITSAKETLKKDLFAAKAWLLTAKVLYPLKFGVQFLGYQIEKTTNNMKDTAKCFADLLATFPNEPEMCSEVQRMTEALREFEEQKGILENADYLVKLFYQLPSAVQRRLLLACANNTPDPMEHCKLMLLLFQKFPDEILVFGCEVMENLITAEKHSPLGGTSLNCFRKLLVCELLPLIAQSSLELQHQNMMRLLDKAVEFYLVYAFDSSKRTRRDERERDIPVIEDPWAKLWEVILHIAIKMKWDLASGFTRYWSKESYFKTLKMFAKRPDEGSQRQMAFCTLLVLLRCIHEYLPSVEPGTTETGYVLLEGFCHLDNSQSGPNPKVKKIENDDPKAPIVTAGNGAPDNLIPAFLAAIRCLDALHTNEFVRREYLRLRSQWRVDEWLKTFLMDAALYHGSYEQRTHHMQSFRSDEQPRSPIAVELTHLTWCYRSADHFNTAEAISNIAGLLERMTDSGPSNIAPLSTSTRRPRHIHFLPLTRAAILQYCVKVLLNILQNRNNDISIGHKLVLMQLNWPAECEILNEITELLQMKGAFAYPAFSNYVVNIDILERFAFLAGPNGPKISLDLFAGNLQVHSQRRMSTRGVDKGVKEDFKAAMRSQVARWNEPIDELIMRFLRCERDLLHHGVL